MISLLLPSRGRPTQLVEMWHTACETATDIDDVEMVVRVDDDDSSYDLLRSRGARGQVHWVSGRRDTMSALWNDSYDHAHGDIYMHCADDIRFRTPDWDLHVKTAFDKIPDRIAFVYGRDGVHDQNLGTHGFLSKEWVEIVGEFLPSYFSCDFADLWIDRVAERIGRRIFIPEILTEHMHPAVGKGPLDQTHQDRLNRDITDNNPQRYRDLQYIRDEWCEQLLGAIMHPGVAS